MPKVNLPKKQFVLKDPGVFDDELIPDGVQNLGLHNQTGIDLRGLPGEHLKSLQLSGIDDLTLEGVADLPLLELSITKVSSVDLSPLANHQTLRVLSLKGIDAIHSVEVLTELPTLETVRLGDIEEASEMDVLAALSRNNNLAGVSYGIMSKLSLKELAKRAQVLTGSSDGGTTVETGVLG